MNRTQETQVLEMAELHITSRWGDKTRPKGQILPETGSVHEISGLMSGLVVMQGVERWRCFVHQIKSKAEIRLAKLIMEHSKDLTQRRNII